VAQSNCEDVLADFAHQLRQPLSALEALTSYLDLITTPEDTRVHEQLRRMHSEIGHADQILRDGLRTLRAYLPNQGRSVLADVPVAAPREDVVEKLTRPLTKAAMASVTH
jgi:signal transduction histidine kinase